MTTFIWPLDPALYPVTRDFYYKASTYVGGQHAAIDQGAPLGAPLVATAVGRGINKGSDSISGNYIGLEHVVNGVIWRSYYRHLAVPSPIAIGQGVSQGQVIGAVGDTGWSTGPHLHFDLWCSQKIRDDGAILEKHGWYAVDPLLYLGVEAPEEDNDDMLVLIQDENGGPVCVSTGTERWPLTTNDERKIVARAFGDHLDNSRVIKLPHAIFERIRPVVSVPALMAKIEKALEGIDPLTRKEVIGAVKQALREGTD